MPRIAMQAAGRAGRIGCERTICTLSADGAYYTRPKLSDAVDRSRVRVVVRVKPSLMDGGPGRGGVFESECAITQASIAARRRLNRNAHRVHSAHPYAIALRAMLGLVGVGIVARECWVCECDRRTWKAFSAATYSYIIRILK